MSRIPDDLIAQIRDAADIVSIIGEQVDLKRSGADYRGPCPFHGGTNRNFSVSAKRAFFYCFVCHEKGDVFSWFVKRLGMDWPSAVREVARRVGIVVPESREREVADPREPFFATLAVAHDWCTRQLAEAADAEPARKYLASRDIPLETALGFGLGWAPDGAAMLAALRELGYDDERLVGAQLAVRRDDGRVHARFRARLLFPIHDLRGRVVGFGGRTLGDGQPKYLNSPDSDLFHKGQLLYNLHAARNAIRQAEDVLVVEGYVDVLRLVMAGIEHVVAPLGTALTTEQAALLRRYTRTVTLLYDSDQAGLKATFRSGDELLRQGMRVRVVTLPAGEDPDSLVRTGGAAALTPLLDDAVDVFERKLQVLERKGWFGDVERQREALDKLLPTLRATGDPIMRDLYVQRVVERTGVSRRTLEEELARPDRTVRVQPPTEPAGEAPPWRSASDRPGVPGRRRVSPEVAREAKLLGLLIAAPALIESAAHDLKPGDITHPVLAGLFRALVAQPAEDRGRLPPAGVDAPVAAAWEKLRARYADVDEFKAGPEYEVLVEWLQVQPHLEHLRSMTDLAAKVSRKAELRRLFPRLPDAVFALKRSAQRSADRSDPRG